MDDEIYCYDGYITTIYRIAIKNNQISRELYIPYVCYYEKEFDKNWAFVEKRNEALSFLNWFEPDGVTMTHVTSDACTKEIIIEYQNDLLSGIADKKTEGAFSLGTPFHPLKATANEFDGIAMGHLKLSRTIRYTNPNIGQFLAKIRELFNHKVVMHTIYHYLCYFMRLRRNGSKYTLTISDAFLVVPDKPQEYVFTINFPIGIDVHDGLVRVGMGLGDYNTMSYTKHLDAVLKSIKHDVANFSHANFEYNMEKVAVTM
jgi:hypothetical protein